MIYIIYVCICIYIYKYIPLELNEIIDRSSWGGSSIDARLILIDARKIFVGRSFDRHSIGFRSVFDRCSIDVIRM